MGGCSFWTSGRWRMRRIGLETVGHGSRSSVLIRADKGRTWPVVRCRRGWNRVRRSPAVGIFIRGSWLFGCFVFSGRGRIVLGLKIEVDPVRGTHRLQMLAGPFGGLGVFAHDAGQKKALGVLQVPDQFDSQVAGANDAQMKSDV